MLSLITSFREAPVFCINLFYSHISLCHPQIGKHSCVFGMSSSKNSPTYYACVTIVEYFTSLTQVVVERGERGFSAPFNTQTFVEIVGCPFSKCFRSFINFSWWYNTTWISLVGVNVGFQVLKLVNPGSRPMHCPTLPAVFSTIPGTWVVDCQLPINQKYPYSVLYLKIWK